MDTPNSRFDRFINRKLPAVLELLASEQRSTRRQPTTEKLISSVISMLAENEVEGSYERVLTWERSNRHIIHKMWKTITQKYTSNIPEGSMNALTNSFEKTKLDEKEKPENFPMEVVWIKDMDIDADETRGTLKLIKLACSTCGVEYPLKYSCANCQHLQCSSSIADSLALRWHPVAISPIHLDAFASMTDYVSGSIITAIFAEFSALDPLHFFASTEFIDNVYNLHNNIDSTSSNLREGGVPKWLLPLRSQVDSIIIPVFHSNGLAQVGHWTLVHINFVSEIVTSYDPDSTTRSYEGQVEQAWKILKSTVAVVSKYFEWASQLKEGDDDWIFQTIDRPKQPDPYSCGVCVIEMANKIAEFGRFPRFGEVEEVVDVKRARSKWRERIIKNMSILVI